MTFRHAGDDRASIFVFTHHLITTEFRSQNNYGQALRRNDGKSPRPPSVLQAEQRKKFLIVLGVTVGDRHIDRR